MRQRDLFLFWLPLFASWLLMTAEGPILSAVVNRLPNEVVMLAALGIVFSLAVTIESPIVNLLATATALVKDRQSFDMVRRFTIHWMVLLTAVGAALAWTPLFDLVVLGALAVPSEVAHWVRPGLGILVLWSPAIAWRRFLQGVMIHFHETRWVARGTILRLFSTAGTAFSLATWSTWSGIHIAAAALQVGVVVEALYATWASRGIVRRHLPAAEREKNGEPREVLTYRKLFDFHWPLATTAMLSLAAQPMVAFTLARLDRPTESLAAWPLIFHVSLWMRSMAFALPEVVIAKMGPPEAFVALRRFALTLTACGAVGMAIFAVTPVSDLYLGALQDTPAEIAELAGLGFLLFIPLPALATLAAWVRGLLIHSGHPAAVNRAMVLTIITISVGLLLGLSLGWPGIVTAGVAINSATLVQLVDSARSASRRAGLSLWKRA